MISKEQQLFDLLKKNIMPDLKKCEDKKSRYDCYSEKHSIDIELKCRRTHYDNLLIERDKYEALVLRSKQKKTTPIYINSTPVGVWSFKINEIPMPIWENKYMPYTTDFSDNESIIKQVGYYSTSLGKNLTKLLK